MKSGESYDEQKDGHEIDVMNGGGEDGGCSN